MGDKVLTKGTIEPSAGDAGFFPVVFMVPNDKVCLSLIFNLKQFNCFMHIRI